MKPATGAVLRAVAQYAPVSLRMVASEVQKVPGYASLGLAMLTASIALRRMNWAEVVSFNRQTNAYSLAKNGSKAMKLVKCF